MKSSSIKFISSITRPSKTIKIKFPFLSTTSSPSSIVVDRKGNLIFIVFDGLVIDDMNLMEDDFINRFQRVTDYVERMNQDNFPFEIRLQIYYKLRDIERALNQISPILHYKTDGIIFTRCNWHYKPGYNKPILKWKPPNLQTIDFLLRKTGGEYGLYVRGQNGYEEFSTIRVPDEEIQKYDELLEQIIECSYDYSSKNWIYLRTREDKTQPNGEWVADGIRECINDNITKIALIRYVLNLNEREKTKSNRGGGGNNNTGNRGGGGGGNRGGGGGNRGGGGGNRGGGGGNRGGGGGRGNRGGRGGRGGGGKGSRGSGGQKFKLKQTE